ncbi:MAG: TonB-dependent receptor [Gammaproteobacteria bacterium]|nr:TonB-dependent receptor [Gammaproteobacteria bacterium]
MPPRFAKICLLFLVPLLFLSAAPLSADELIPVYKFKIKRQSLATALLDFSYQSDVQVVMPGSLAEGLLSNEVNGEYSVHEALTKLLQHTGLEYQFSSERTVTIGLQQQDPTLSSRRRKRFEQLDLEQLLVTGEQRHDQIKDITVSQVSLTGDDLESRGVKNADELQQFVPGLTVEAPQTSNTEFSIRGVGISNDDLTTQPGVAVFLDDIYIPRQGSANMALYELDRVQVLRGPQSTLYGRNATGGSIVYITRKSSADFEARYMVDAGNYNHFNNLLSVNGELKPGVAGQVALAGFKRDPIMQNEDPYVGGNNTDSKSGRLAFRVSQSDRYEWLLSLDRENRQQQGVLYSIGPQGSFQFAEGLPLVELSDPVRSSDVDTPGFEDLEVTGMMSRLNVHAGHHEASYIFGRRNHEFMGLYDLDQTAELLVNKQFRENSDSASFEARWSSIPLVDEHVPGNVTWMLGVLALEEKAEAFKNYLAPGLLAGENQWLQSLEEKSYSVYAQIQYQLSTRFRLSSGLRYIADFRNINLHADTSAPGIDNPYLLESFDFGRERAWRRLTPRMALHYQFDPESSVYLSASSGYKPGGYSGTAGNLAQAGIAYRHERVSSYELGIQSKWFANRMKINAAVYSAQYRDMQVSGYDVVGNSFVQNAENVASDGFEIELQARPTTSLKISMGLSFIDAEFERFLYESEGQRIDKTGDRVPRIPDATFNLSAVYLFPDTPLGSWSLRADATYSEEAEDINNDLAWPSHRNYSLWLDYLPHNGKWELTLWVRNLANSEYFQASSPGITNTDMAFARKLEPPRVSGLSLKYFW